MMLQPRKFTYKTRHKTRKTKSWASATLNYGDFGVRILNPLRLSAKQIFRLKLFLKRAVKKADVTRRKVWFAAFPHLPLTKKPKGLRMGKGAGKLASWTTQLRGGVNLVEFKNLRLGRSLYFYKQIAHKLPVKSTYMLPNDHRIKIAHLRRLNVIVRTFW